MSSTKPESESAEITQLIAEVWSQLGGRGTNADVLAHMKVVMPPDLAEYCTDAGLRTKIAGFFRMQTKQGLPQAPAVDKHGTHAQLELLDVGEYRYVIARYMESAAADRAQAVKAQALCLEHHGILIDLEDPWADEASA